MKKILVLTFALALSAGFASAQITIEARSSVDTEERGVAVLRGQRGGRDESWGGSWSGPDSEGEQAYFRVGALAWVNDQSDDSDQV